MGPNSERSKARVRNGCVEDSSSIAVERRRSEAMLMARWKVVYSRDLPASLYARGESNALVNFSHNLTLTTKTRSV